MTKPGSNPADAAPALTQAQQTVLELIAKGYSSQEIAKKLSRSIRTVESHRYHLGKKLGSKNQVDLIQRAQRLGLLPNDVPLAVPVRRHSSGNPDAVSAASLRTIAACMSAKIGRDGILTSVSHLATVMQARAVFFAEVLTRHQLRITACHSPEGSLLRLQLPYSEELRGIAEPHGAVGVPFDSLPPDFTAEIERIVGTPSILTVEPVRDCDRVLGYLFVLHDHPLDRQLMPELLLESVADRIRCDISFMESSKRSSGLKSLLDQADQLGWLGTLEICFATGKVFPTRTASDLLGLNSEAGSLAMEDLLGSLHDQDRNVFQSALSTAATGHESVSVSVRAAPRQGVSNRVTLLIPGAPHARRQTGTVPALVLADAQPVRDSSTASLIQRMVSRCPSPTVTIDSDGTICAASPAWRCLTERVPGRAHTTNYFQQIRSMTGDQDFAQIQRVISKTFSSRTAEPASMTVDFKGYDFGIAIGLIPISGSGLINVTHNKSADVDVRSAWWSVDPSPGLLGARKMRGDDSGKAGRDAWANVQSELVEWAIENSNDLLCICDTDGWIRRANPMMCRVLEYDVSDLVGESFMGLFFEKDHAFVHHLLASLSAGHSVDRVVMPMRTATGDSRFIEWSASPPPPGSIQFLPIGRDVTEQANATRGLLKIREQFSRYLGPESP